LLQTQSNTSTSPGKKSFQTLCGNWLRNQLFDKSKVSLRLIGGRNKKHIRKRKKIVYQPELVKSRRVTSERRSASCLVNLSIISVLLRAGAAGLS
jgi:hypothetical protein